MQNMRPTPISTEVERVHAQVLGRGPSESRGEKFSKGGTLMTWGQKLHSTIERRDASALRRMAEEARKEETRLFLNLLAGMIEQQAKKATQLKRTA